MSIVNTLLEQLCGLLGKILPKLNVDSSFLDKLDLAIANFIDILESISFFLPLDIFVLCLTTIFLADNWHVLYKVGKWVISKIIDLLPL